MAFGIGDIDVTDDRLLSRRYSAGGDSALNRAHNTDVGSSAAKICKLADLRSPLYQVQFGQRTILAVRQFTRPGPFIQRAYGRSTCSRTLADDFRQRVFTVHLPCSSGKHLWSVIHGATTQSDAQASVSFAVALSI